MPAGLAARWPPRPLATRAGPTYIFGPAVERALSTPIKKVWIEEGCISCSLCSDYVPEVFRVAAGEPCEIRQDAGRHFAAKDEEIRDAARDCPVEVIRLEEQP